MSCTDITKVLKVGDTMTGTLILNTINPGLITPPGHTFIAGTTMDIIELAGTYTGATGDAMWLYTTTGDVTGMSYWLFAGVYPDMAVTKASAANQTSAWDTGLGFSINTPVVPATGLYQYVIQVTDTVTLPSIQADSTVTASDFVGDGSGLTGITAGQVGALAPDGDGSGLTGIMKWSEVPGSTGATGATGDVAYDEGHLYVCVGEDYWKRAALTEWE